MLDWCSLKRAAVAVISSSGILLMRKEHLLKQLFVLEDILAYLRVLEDALLYNGSARHHMQVLLPLNFNYTKLSVDLCYLSVAAPLAAMIINSSVDSSCPPFFTMVKLCSPFFEGEPFLNTAAVLCCFHCMYFCWNWRKSKLFLESSAEWLLNCLFMPISMVACSCCCQIS
ncbi:hypothetical protein FGO68_gene16499 [Halteria grandinella]|uniref:Uncharacterized protein n=1 Tax=Halteria grandinella TaxID=5974 RepID=A0A8J8P6M0_HALGN|nr:hypothetical protein FGO68_gene16499 [Halteria grandinella]